MMRQVAITGYVNVDVVGRRACIWHIKSVQTWYNKCGTFKPYSIDRKRFNNIQLTYFSLPIYNS